MPQDAQVAAGFEPLNDAPCGIVVIDGTDHIIHANRTVAGWLGTPAVELRGRPATSLFSLASSMVFETCLLPLLRLQDEVEGTSLDLVTADGAGVPVIMSAGRRGDAANPLTQLVLLRAVGRRDFERDLLRARAEAETRLAAEHRQVELREQFVAVLGHDLRNPLAAMASAIRMLSRSPDADRREEILRLMQGSVQRMSRLIDNILDFARNRLGGGILLDVGTGDLGAVISQAVSELRSVHRGRDIRSNISIRHEVACDVWRIGQIVSNLLGNAISHGDPDQPVLLAAVTRGPGELEISVVNSGEPIPAALIAKLFDPFERGGSRNRTGLGLGLHIASEIAKAHGGVIEVSCDDLIRFTFRMPAPPGREGAAVLR